MSDARVGHLRDDVAAHAPADARERRSRSQLLALLDWLPAPFDETADPTHVTASAVVVDPTGRVLLHRHKRLGIWLQPGGHVEGGESPQDAAVRETLEETGVVAAPTGGLVHLDVHEGPRAHVHLDVRYLLRASTTFIMAPAETDDIAWLDPRHACERTDASAALAIRASIRRWRKK